MSWDEFCTRLGQEITKRAEYAIYRTGVSPSSREIPAPSPAAGKFFFAPDQIPGRVELLEQHLPSVVLQTAVDADQILRHRFSIFGYGKLDYGRQIDCDLDPVH